ncbi:hypothetical protein [Nitratireductor luteus]|uniref:hypothetical protein n=1 Tax=Nitratireductor luteus TaxID=2976980 RepID=UPI00223F4B9E|nr:hypothetical protein [Nitratireductor luteus]
MTGKLRSAVLVVGLALLPVVFGAQTAKARPDTRTMTCDQANSLVRQSGAIVLTTGRFTYNRFVVDERYCPMFEIAERAYVPTQDAAQCLVGYRCIIDRNDDDNWRWLRPRR